MNSKECRKVFLTDAESGARKLCGANCVCAFSCRRKKNNTVPTLPKVGTADVCPLDKYRVPMEQNQVPWYKLKLEETQPTEYELFALCACCKNTSVSQDGEFWELEVNDAEMCLDCPVKLDLDGMQALAAEKTAEKEP